jgi:hypothetical protein
MTPAVVLPGGFGPSQQEGEVAAAAAAAAAGVSDGQSGGHGTSETAEAAASAVDGATAAATAGEGSYLASAAAAAGDDVQQQQLQQQQHGLSMLPDESESDILPFAIDSEATASHAVCYGPHAGAVFTVGGFTAAAGRSYSRVVPAAGYNQQQQQQQLGQQQQRSAGYGVSDVAGRAAGLPAAAAERDVAVGAFVKLIQEAAAVPFQRTKQQQQQQCGAEGGVAEAAQPQPLLVGDALQQVQQLAAQLHALVFSGGSG